MAYKIRISRKKNYLSVPKIQASLSRHLITHQQISSSQQSNLAHNHNPINFNLQTLPISNFIKRKYPSFQISHNSNNLVQLKSQKRVKGNKLKTLYYQYRNGKQGKSLESLRMTLVRLALKYYKIDSHDAELQYIHNAQMDRNAAANYTLKDDNSIDKTFIKFYPQLFELPFNSFINTIRHEAYHIFLYNKGIYDVDQNRRCHKPIHEFLAEAKEIISRNQENPQQFYQDANRALKYWILIYKNLPLPDFRDIQENELMEFIKKQYARIQKQVTKRYADFVDEHGKDNQLAKKFQQLINQYEQHRQ